MTVRAGQWKAPTRFFPCGRSIAGLAADRRVDLADEGRRHRHPVDAAQVGRGREAGGVGRAAAAERDERPPRSSRSSCQSAVERGKVFASSPARQLVRLREPRAERELGVHAVDAGDVAGR